MKKDGKTYHAKFVNEGGYIWRYTGNENGSPTYGLGSGNKHCFDADDRFSSVPNNEWVEEFESRR